MIVSNDSIMKPPYDITNEILQLLTAISEKIGRINAVRLDRPSPELRKKNRIKTIKASLEIEGNSLSEKQITAILENKRVLAPEKELKEVQNAISTYEAIGKFEYRNLESFLFAHKLLMESLVDKPGRLRTKQVGIVKGENVNHIAPPAQQLPFLMDDLFRYIGNSDDHVLIKS